MGLTSWIHFLLLFILKQKSVYIGKVLPNCNYVRKIYFSNSKEH